MVAETNESNFQNDVLNADTRVLVDFYAPWCGPCKMIAPMLDELSKEFSNLKIIKLNVDESPVIAGKYSISGVPTLIMFRDGQPLKTTVGAPTKDGLRDFINSAV